MLIADVLLLIITIISFYFAFAKTGLWKFTHQTLQKLDERELLLTSNSLRIAYSIFTVFTLSILLILSVLDIKISIVLVVSLIYFAHVLPATIIGFR